MDSSRDNNESNKLLSSVDWVTVLLYVILVVAGAISIYAATTTSMSQTSIFDFNTYSGKQFLWIGLSFVFGFSLLLIDRRMYEGYAYLIYGIMIILLILTAFISPNIKGSHSWLKFGAVSIQPAEFAKLSIVTLLSYIFAKTQKNRDISNKGLIWAGFVVLVFGGLMVKSGLTNTLLLMAISISMLLIGGAKFKKIFIVGICFILMAGGFFIIKSHNDEKEQSFKEMQASTPGAMSPQELEEAVADKKGDGTDRTGTWKSRFMKWWNSDSLVYKPITAENQQEMFSRMAQAHGGMLGVGIGRSRECSRLPLAFSDYIFSIIVEETGFLGGLFVLLLYLSLLGRAAMIVRRSKRVLPSLLVIGMASYITFQALFHIAINVGLFPVSGQPLPLISKGGSSMLAICIAFGVMLSVSRTIANQGNKKNKADETPIIEGLDAVNPTEIPARNVWK